MQLKQLETFLWIAELRSFRQVAEQMHATQPAISARIASLENELGAKLFERNTGSVRLTAKGLELLPFVEKAVSLSNQIRERASEGLTLSGVLRLGVSETIVHTWLPKYLSALHEHCPNVDVDLSVDVTTNLRDDLIARKLDLAFLLGPVSEYRIHNDPLSSYPLTWIGSPALRTGRDNRLSMQDLLAFPILSYARNTRPHLEIRNYFREHSDVPARIFASTSISALLRLTVDGIGFSTLPTKVVERELKSGELMEFEFDWCPGNLNFTASYSTEPHNAVAEYAAGLAAEIADT